MFIDINLFILGDGKSIELKEICAKFTTDMVGLTAYGLKVNSLNNPEAEFRMKGRCVFKHSYLRIMEFNTMFFAPALMKPLGFKFFSSEATEFLRDALWSTLIERERSGQKRNDLIDLLIELKNNEKNNPENIDFGK